MKTQLKVLALVRDMGAGNVVSPVVQELHRRGHKTLLLAEEGGQAMNRLAPPFATVRDEAKVASIVSGMKPQVVISGLSSPRFLESWLDRWAAQNAVPLVTIEDYWGVAQRSPVAPDLVVTIDEAAAQLVHERCPGSKVVIAGFAGILPVTPRPSLVESFTGLRAKTGAEVIVYTDSGPDAEESLPTLVESILRTKVPVILAPKFHPKDKMIAHPDGGTWGDWCERQVKPLRDAGLIADFAEPADEVVELADATFSGYSTLLMRAAKAGKVAVTLWNEAVRKSLKKETGLDMTPLMMRAEYPIVTRPQSLDGILYREPPVLDLRAFDAKVAAEAIEALV